MLFFFSPSLAGPAHKQKVLAHEVNVGYEGMSNLQLLAFNGERIRSLEHLVRLADNSKEPFLRFEFYPERVVVLEAAGIPAATTQICRENSIPSPRSADLLEKVPPPSSPIQAKYPAGEEGKKPEAEQPLPAINGSPRPAIAASVPTTTLGSAPGRRGFACVTGAGRGVGLRSAAVRHAGSSGGGRGGSRIEGGGRRVRRGSGAVGGAS